MFDLYESLFGESMSKHMGTGLAPGCEIISVKFKMKDGTEREGHLVTNKSYPAIKQYSFSKGHPLSNAYVDMDLVESIEELNSR
jgi:hypothetical protein